MSASCVVFVTLAGLIGAQDAPQSLPRFELRGAAFGDPEPRRMNLFGMGCSKDELVKSADLCADVDKPPKIAGVQIASIVRGYLDKQLYTLSLYFDSDDYEALAEALAAKYGEPISTTHQEVQNVSGATFTNEKKTWLFNDASMAIERYGSRITEGRVFAASTDRLAEYEKRRKAIAAEAAAKDLGAPVKR
jgi:hypothetical protein